MVDCLLGVFFTDEKRVLLLGFFVVGGEGECWLFFFLLVMFVFQVVIIYKGGGGHSVCEGRLGGGWSYRWRGRLFMGGGDDGGRGGEVSKVAGCGLGRRLGRSRCRGGSSSGGDNRSVEAELVEDLDEVLEVVARDFEAALLGLDLFELGGILLDRALVLELGDLSGELADFAEQYRAFVLDHLVCLCLCLCVCCWLFSRSFWDEGEGNGGEGRCFLPFVLSFTAVALCRGRFC